MAITDFKIQGYRSIKDLWLKLLPINVIVGQNGTGKSNLYRAMYLLACAARGEFAEALAEEGGIESALWAGDWGKNDHENCLSLSMRTDKYEYNLLCGRAGNVARPVFFEQDPVIKEEEFFKITGGKKKRLLIRRLRSVFAHNAAGKEIEYSARVGDNESILSALKDPVNFPDLYALREEILGWRFYHGFRKDVESPLRLPRIGVMTAALSHDGHDLAAVLASIMQAGDRNALEAGIDEAFPGATLAIAQTRAGLTLSFSQPGIIRPFSGTELSDGTLQYFCLLASLLSLSAPPVIVLNEPETSLHPNLIEPLARLITKSGLDTQVWITTHSRELADRIMDLSGYESFELTKVEGQTKLVGVGLGGFREDREDQAE